ncbi:hypothetical protein AB5J62_10850 [Amycolatopsis sp. cg5]|uniref:hypothetical protein n=1 Tax=Amycolatopsis sp. cg5 TaxID=3238802 RepID=UPI00352446B0
MSTKFDAKAITDAAGKLGSIMDDMKAFTELKANWPNAGKFPLAQWLERIVDDRRNGVVAHAEHLKLALEEMETTLTKIAKDFTNLDGENAKKVSDSIGELKKHIRDDIVKLDEGTESEQGNFTDQKDDKDNATDGDGYDDALYPGKKK